MRPSNRHDQLIAKVFFQKGLSHFPGIHAVYALSYGVSQAGYLLGPCPRWLAVVRMAGKKEAKYSLMFLHFGNLAALTRRF